MVEQSLLILGGTGIIGRELCATAQASGHRVSVVSRGRKPIQSSTIELIVGDARDALALTEALAGRYFDAVVDLVSYTAEQVDQNLSIMANRCGQYVFVSSATVYSGSGPDNYITEGSPRVKNGRWSYPALKLMAEDALRAKCLRTGQVYTIVRPYITYSSQRIPFGAWETESVLGRILAERPVFIGEAMARSVTSLTHAEDLANGIVQLLGNPSALNEDFHIASDEWVTWAEVQTIAAEVLDKPLQLVVLPDDRVASLFPELLGKIEDRLMDRKFDNGKLLRATPGFEFQYSVRAGFAAAIEALLSQGLPRSSPAYQGRLDRLADSSRSLRAERRMHARALMRQSPVDYLRYASGRHPLLSALKETSYRAGRAMG